jgi:hypothetical protein
MGDPVDCSGELRVVKHGAIPRAVTARELQAADVNAGNNYVGK